MRIWTTRCWVLLALLSLVLELGQAPRSLGAWWGESALMPRNPSRNVSQSLLLAKAESASADEKDDAADPALDATRGDDSGAGSGGGKEPDKEGRSDRDSDATADDDTGSESDSDADEGGDSDPKSADESDEKPDGSSSEQREETERKAGEENDEENSGQKDDPLSLLRAAAVAFSCDLTGQELRFGNTTRLCDLTTSDALLRPPRSV